MQGYEQMEYHSKFAPPNADGILSIRVTKLVDNEKDEYFAFRVAAKRNKGERVNFLCILKQEVKGTLKSDNIKALFSLSGLQVVARNKNKY